MANPSILPLESCVEPNLVGGKAAGLARLITHGFRVPPGICLTTVAYRDALRQAGLDSGDRWAGLEQAPLADRQRMLEEYRQRIETLVVPQSVMDALHAGLSRLAREFSTQGECLWAVRSSATNEDGTRASFAGVYRTLLGVPQEGLPPAICTCWASLWTEVVFSYQQRAAFKTPPEMAIVLQPLINPIAAGVAYSRHPLTGRSDVVVVNAVWGLAEPLVGGAATPDRYGVIVGTKGGSSAIRVIERDIAEKRTRRMVTVAGVRDEPVPGEIQKEPAVQEPDLIHLATLTKRVEQMIGRPVDVEWAIDQAGLWLLQARPIPGMPTARGLTPEACEWSRANFKETLPELPSPLGLSFLEQFMETNILSHYRKLGCVIPRGLSAVRIVRGRPYINVTLFQSFTAQLGGDPALVAEQMGGEGTARAAGSERLAWWKVAWAGLLMLWAIRQAARRAPSWFAELKRMAQAETDDRGRSLAPTDIPARLDRLGQRLNEGDLTFAIVAGVSQGLQALNYFLERWVGECWRPLLNAALQGQGDVISVEQILWLTQLAEIARSEPTVQAFLLVEPWSPDRFRMPLAGTRFLQEFNAYLVEYGHRGIGESDVMSPRFIEQPEYLLGVIRAHVQAPQTRSVSEVLQQQESARHTALQQISTALGWRLPHRVIFQWWYRRLCRYLALREANRHHLMYFSAAVRRLSLVLGQQWTAQGIFESPEDVFFLTSDEIRTAVADSGQGWSHLVSSRREEWRQHAEHRVPDFLSSGEEPTLAGGQPRGGGETLRGIPISAGSVEGPVCRVLSPGDLAKVKPGDIIVTPVIDPGMAPLFGLAAGLVAEMGGTLSHGAIIAREYGLPAIANVPGVTRLLKDGERVVVDATRGTVHSLEGNRASSRE